MSLFLLNLPAGFLLKNFDVEFNKGTQSPTSAGSTAPKTSAAKSTKSTAARKSPSAQGSAP